MASKRYDLHHLLVSTTGLTNVYFQPPSSATMKYPCVIYKREGIHTTKADNGVYARKDKYQILIIDRDPDSVYLDSLIEVPLCTFDRQYVTDGLHHVAYTLYF